MSPSKASITVDHILWSFEKYVEEQIDNQNLERDSEVHCGLQNPLSSFRQHQENLATPRQNSRLHSPQNQFNSSSKLLPENTNNQSIPGLGETQQTIIIQLHSQQPSVYSPARLLTSEDSAFTSHTEEVHRVEHAGHQICDTELQLYSSNMFSGLDFEPLLEDKPFSSNMMFNDCDIQSLDIPGA